MLSRNEYCMESWQKSLEIEVCVHVCQETSGPVLCDCCAISFHQKGYCISVLGKRKKNQRWQRSFFERKPLRHGDPWRALDVLLPGAATSEG